MRPAALSGLRAITNPESPIPAPSRVARVSGAHPGFPPGRGGRERVGGPTHLPDRPSRMRPAALSGLRAITNHESPIPNHESRITNPQSRLLAHLRDPVLQVVVVGHPGDAADRKSRGWGQGGEVGE